MTEPKVEQSDSVESVVLLPCPFCCYEVGREDLVEELGGWCVKCPVCDSRGSVRASEKTAASYWNMRGKRAAKREYPCEWEPTGPWQSLELNCRFCSSKATSDDANAIKHQQDCPVLVARDIAPKARRVNDERTKDKAE